MRKLGAFFYEWATVIAGIAVAGVSCSFEILDAVADVDLTPLLPPEYASRIVAGVAVAKALHCYYRSRRA